VRLTPKRKGGREKKAGEEKGSHEKEIQTTGGDQQPRQNRTEGQPGPRTVIPQEGLAEKKGEGGSLKHLRRRSV